MLTNSKVTNLFTAGKELEQMSCDFECRLRVRIGYEYNFTI